MEYLKILGFQLKVNLSCNHYSEHLLIDSEFRKEMKETLKIASELNPDIVVYPEMCYSEDYEKEFINLSKNKLIVAGSIYKENRNMTVVYKDKKKQLIEKRYASGAEPMTRYIDYLDPEEFIDKYLKDHIFIIKGKKIVVLNCMEYYHVAYYLARKFKDIFAFISPCSNNNQKVFIEETRALHNHNENVYSFVVNCISDYNNKSYAKGRSYIYGPIQYHEKEWIRKEGICNDSHNSSILNLDELPSYFYGEFTNNLISYGRSDRYSNNPKKILVKYLGLEKIYEK